MAKQQTFGDKLKKKAAGEMETHVKVIKPYFTEEGNMRFLERQSEGERPFRARKNRYF